MSAAAPRVPLAERSDGLLVVGVILAGLGALVLRLAALGDANASVLFGLTYLALGTASVAVALPAASDGHVGTPLVLVIGLCAVALAAGWGPAFPKAHGPEVLALDLLAAVAEEAFFRRLVFGGLLRFGVVAAIGGSALLFAGVHVPTLRFGGVLGRPRRGAAVLLATLGQRERGARPAATHAAANLLAVLR